MARSVKIEALLDGLDQALPVLGKLDVSTLAESECKIVAVLVNAITAYNTTELDAEDQTELAKLEASLAKLDAKHDKIASKYYLEIAPRYAEIATEHGKDPVALMVAMTELEAQKAEKIETFQVQRETDTAITNESILAIKHKKTLAGLDAAKEELKFTDSTTGKTTNHKIGQAEFLVLDLLKTRSAHGQFHVGEDRVVRFMPIHADWAGKKNDKEKIEIGEWYVVGTLAKTDDLTYQTSLQRWCYDWVNRYTGSFQENTDRVNAVFVQGSAKSIGVQGRTGGTANVHRVVDEKIKGEGRQVKREDLQDKEQYNLIIEKEDGEKENAK